MDLCGHSPGLTQPHGFRTEVKGSENSCLFAGDYTDLPTVPLTAWELVSFSCLFVFLLVGPGNEC